MRLLVQANISTGHQLFYTVLREGSQNPIKAAFFAQNVTFIPGLLVF